jgi:hypothetical protein
MDRKSVHASLQAELQGLVLKAGGAGGTRSSRAATMNRFAAHLKERGYTISSAQQIKLKHVTSFLDAYKQIGMETRTVHNQASHLREILRQAGRDKFVREQLSSNQLNIGKSSRDGTKFAMPDRRYDDTVALALARDKGIAAGLMLCRTLGLRGQEAVMSTQHLSAWRSALESRIPLPVIVSSGTKGGRIRELPVSLIPNKEAALKAVKFAQGIAAERGGVLIDKPTLRQAIDRWDNECRAIGLQGKQSAHSLRYAFTVETLTNLKAQGLSEKHAYQLASCLLGHGEGRGRWVKQVYSRTAPEES